MGEYPIAVLKQANYGLLGELLVGRKGGNPAAVLKRLDQDAICDCSLGSRKGGNLAAVLKHKTKCGSSSLAFAAWGDTLLRY